MDCGTYKYHFMYSETEMTRELNADQVDILVEDLQDSPSMSFPVYTDYFSRGDDTIYYIDSLLHDKGFRCGHGAVAKQVADRNTPSFVTPRLDLSWFIPVGAEHDPSRDLDREHPEEPEYDDSETEEEAEEEKIVRFVTISDRLATALGRATVTMNQQEGFLTRYLERVEDQIINVLESLNE